MTDSVADIPIAAFGGPTALIEYGGLRFLTDPTFDPAGSYESGLTKTAPATVSAAEVGPIDVVLLSHDQHDDNLDAAGRAFLSEVPLILTTPGGARRLAGHARGMADWESLDLPRPDGGTATVTAVPALHGPGSREDLEPVVGEVVGFVLTGEGLPSVYVSGDNAQLELVEQIAERFAPVDVAVLFAGAVRTSTLDHALLTLNSAQAAEAARILGARRIVPVHFDSWAHFTEGRAELVKAFAAADLMDRVKF